MATLNYAFKEISCKIVYYGCGLCGKTTNLIHVHKTVPGKFRGELVSLATEQDRTLFFDFLPLDLGEVKGFKTKFQLYTVPGQVYYNATRKLVLRGVDGIVFVADSQKDRLQENIESFENLSQNLEEYGYHLQMSRDDHEGVPWVLQLNKRDMPHISSKEEIVEALKIQDANIPIMEAVAVNGGGVKETLKSMSSLVIQKLNSGSGALPSGAPTKTPAPAAQPQKPQPAAPAQPAQPAQPAPPAAPQPAQPAQPPRPAAQPPQPAQPAAAPAQPAAQQPAAPASSGAPALAINQESDGMWRGSKKGGGTIQLNGSGEYTLTGSIKFVGLFGRKFDHKLEPKGTESATIGGNQLQFHKLESTTGKKPPVTVFVPVGDPSKAYVKYLGFGGEIAVVPQGQTEAP